MSSNSLSLMQIEQQLSNINTLFQFTELANKKFNPNIRGDAITANLIKETKKVDELFSCILNGQLIEISEQITNYRSDSFDCRLTELDKKIAEYESNMVRIQEIIIKRKGGFIYEERKRLQIIGLNDVSACVCCDKMNHSKRESFVEYVEQFFPKSSENNGKKIKICSIGSGCCLQELITHTHFLSTKKTVDWVLIDPELTDQSSEIYKASIQFKQFIQFLSPHAEVELVGAPSAALPGHTCYEQLLSNKEEAPDIFLKVDADFDGFPRSYIERRLLELSSKESPKMFAEFSTKRPDMLDINVFNGA
jgi:hypothetical protein